MLPEQPVESLTEYLKIDGGVGLQRAREIGPDAVIAEVATSGLRGRGGAGFPAGTKWATVRAGGGRHRYAVCNAAEGEPATFKDRALMRANPYRVVEGLLIAAYAVDALEVFIALKSSFETERAALERAITEINAAGWIDRTLHVVGGPEEYLYGEEKALLEVIEGNEPLPRWLPPYLHGLFATAPQLGWVPHEPEPGHRHAEESNPTLVNNVETLSNAALILAHGSEAFRARGTDQSPGTVCCTVVGDVTAPAVFEVDLGTPLRTAIERAGGVAEGRRVRAVFSGVSNPVVTAEQLDTPLSYEAFDAIGSGLGAAGFCVYDDTACMVEVAALLSRFLYVESCGQCPPCKLGTGAITGALDRIASGKGDDDDLDLIALRLRNVADGNRCYLPVEEQRMIGSILRAFPEDFAAHIEHGACPRPRELVVPKIVDLVDGVVTYDGAQARKQPDWTYAPA